MFKRKQMIKIGVYVLRVEKYFTLGHVNMNLCAAKVKVNFD